MCRSAAQQIEHWALLGAALEARGVAVADAVKLLRGERAPPATAAEIPEQALWDYKRVSQERDLGNVRAGRSTNAQMSWFSGGRAKATKLVDSSY